MADRKSPAGSRARTAAPDTPPFEGLLSLFDRLPFVANLKRDTATLRNLLYRRRVPRIACVGDLPRARQALGCVLFSGGVLDPTSGLGSVAVPANEGDAGRWIRITGPRARADWLELALADSGDGASRDTTGAPPRRPGQSLVVHRAPADAVVWMLPVAATESGGDDKARASRLAVEVRAVEGLAKMLGEDGTGVTTHVESSDEGHSAAAMRHAAPILVVVVAGTGSGVEHAPSAADLEAVRHEVIKMLGDGKGRAHPPVGIVLASTPADGARARGDGGTDFSADGLSRLAKALFDLLPEETHLEAARAMEKSPALRRAVARRVVHSTAALALTVGLAPVPLSDVLLIVPLQLLMVSTIAYLGGRNLDRQATLEWIGSFGVVGGAGFGFRWAAQQLAKLVPGAGSLVSGSVAGAGTVALGQSAISYFLDRSWARPLGPGSRTPSSSTASTKSPPV